MCICDLCFQTRVQTHCWTSTSDDLLASKSTGPCSTRTSSLLCGRRRHCRPLNPPARRPRRRRPRRRRRLPRSRQSQSTPSKHFTTTWSRRVTQVRPGQHNNSQSQNIFNISFYVFQLKTTLQRLWVRLGSSFKPRLSKMPRQRQKPK